MYKKLLQCFSELTPLNEQQSEELSRVAFPQELPKETVLLKWGQISNHLHFIVEGVVRSIYYTGNKEVIPWFGFEGDIINSHLSFVYRKPSLKSIVLISDCKFLTISYESVQYLYSQDICWVNLSRLFTERYYLDVQNRLISFLSLSAAERYDQLLDSYPNIEERVKLGHLASYLGVTQETLSRLRLRRKRRKKHLHFDLN